VELRFVLPELRQLDAIPCEALAIPFFADERPPRGALGLVDWRLCGMISKMLVRNRIRGDYGETVLVPGRPRLNVDKLFLFGLGSGDPLEESVVEEVTENMLRTLTLAGVRSSALVLPGRSVDRFDPARAMELFIRRSAAYREHDEIMLVETAEAQKAMRDVLERERRRVRALSV
jgi:hypothetical protein